MTEKLKNFLKGMASVLDIYPDTNYLKFVPKDYTDPSQEDWVLVGDAIREALQGSGYDHPTIEDHPTTECFR